MKSYEVNSSSTQEYEYSTSTVSPGVSYTYIYELPKKEKRSMKKPVLVGLAVFAVILLLLLMACTKPVQVSTPVQTAPVTPPPVVMAVAAQPAVVVAPTPVSNPVLVVGKKVKKSKTLVKKHKSMSKAERAAYAKAYANAKLANHLLGRNKYQTSFHKHVG